MHDIGTMSGSRIDCNMLYMLCAAYKVVLRETRMCEICHEYARPESASNVPAQERVVFGACRTQKVHKVITSTEHVSKENLGLQPQSFRDKSPKSCLKKLLLSQIVPDHLRKSNVFTVH